MPPLPKSSRRPSTGKRGGEAQGESSSAPRTSGPSRTRATKADVLGEQIARMYMMVGTMLKPFGRFYPVLDPIGENFKDLSKEASEAWMELAAKDKKVLEMLESITGASTWGNVIGIHIAIFASALPGAGLLTGVSSQPDDPMEAEFYRQGKAMGMNDAEIAEAIRQAQASPTPAREPGAGGPGDTVRVAGTPSDSGSSSGSDTQPGQSATASATASGIVSPDELGVTQPGEVQDFPADPSPPNGRGSS